MTRRRRSRLRVADVLGQLLGGIATAARRAIEDPELRGRTPIETTGRVLEVEREREYERLRRGDA